MHPPLGSDGKIPTQFVSQTEGPNLANSNLNQTDSSRTYVVYDQGNLSFKFPDGSTIMKLGSLLEIGANNVLTIISSGVLRMDALPIIPTEEAPLLLGVNANGDIVKTPGGSGENLATTDLVQTDDNRKYTIKKTLEFITAPDYWGNVISTKVTDTRWLCGNYSQDTIIEDVDVKYLVINEYAETGFIGKEIKGTGMSWVYAKPLFTIGETYSFIGASGQPYIIKRAKSPDGRQVTTEITLDGIDIEITDGTDTSRVRIKPKFIYLEGCIVEKTGIQYGLVIDDVGQVHKQRLSGAAIAQLIELSTSISSEITIPGLSYTIPSSGYWKSHIVLNVQKPIDGITGVVRVKEQRNGVVTPNGCRQSSIINDGTICTLDIWYEGELNEGDIMSVKAEGFNCTLVSNVIEGYIAATATFSR